MRCLAFLAAVVCLAGPAATAADQQPPGLLLVLPIFGSRPAEMDLPWAGHLAESLLLALPPGSLRVEAQEPTEPVLPGTVEQVARQRGAELGAQAVLWGELIPPGSCRAPRMIRLRILDLASDQLLTRELCPADADREDISRAVALATANALRAGEVAGITIVPPPRPPKARRPIPRAPGERECPPRPPCPPAAPCPPCPACPGPPPLAARRVFLIASGRFSSHPSWDSVGLGAGLGLVWAPLPWLELGIGMQALRGRRVTIEEVETLYTSWPASVWSTFRFTSGSWELQLGLGLQLAWSRLDVLLERLQATTSVQQLNPALLGELGLRYYTPWGFGLQLAAGPAIHLRRQHYTYGASTGRQTVLGMQLVSLEASLGLVVPLD